MEKVRGLSLCVVWGQVLLDVLGGGERNSLRMSGGPQQPVLFPRSLLSQN